MRPARPSAYFRNNPLVGEGAELPQAARRVRGDSVSNKFPPLTRRLTSFGATLSRKGRGERVCRWQDALQYRFAIGNCSAGNRLITRQPVSVTTTSSSMRAAE